MTLCIAATCLDGDEPKIVMCTDWRAEYPSVGSHENADKLTFIKDGWPVLLSGEGPSEHGLVTTYQKELKNVELTQANVYEQLKAPMHKRKQILADDFLKQTLTMSLRDFLDKGKTLLPDDYYRQRAEEVERIRLGASIIICGFVDTYDYVEKKMERGAVIASVDDEFLSPDKIFAMHEDFTAIGSGAGSAIGVLCRRGQSSDDPLLVTIYNVYEAKVLSESVPGVSRSLSIEVLSADGTMQSLSDEGYKVCDQLLGRFGPRTIKKDKPHHQTRFKMESKYLEPFLKSFLEESEKTKRWTTSSDASTEKRPLS
jgi:hypothetical protein